MSEYKKESAQGEKDNISGPGQSTPFPLMRDPHPAAVIQRVRANPQSFTPSDAIVLQRTIGNPAVGRLLREIGLVGQNPHPEQQKSSKKEIKHPSSDGILSRPIQKKENKTGLPDNLKAGVESLSGLSMDDIRVHYNSHRPAQVGALAYTQGNNIHVAPGQERHLPHEAWHVVQQAQGRVQPTMQLKNVAVNDDAGLESEADQMGGEAISINKSINHRVYNDSTTPKNQSHKSHILQFVKEKPKKLAKVQVRKKLEGKLEAKKWSFATGHCGSGRWSEEVLVRHKHSFSKQRIPQILRHLSTALFFYAKEKVSTEQEVQGMYINSRLFFSSNDPLSLQALTQKDLMDIFYSSKYIPASDKRAVRVMSKLKKFIDKERTPAKLGITEAGVGEDFNRISEMLFNVVNAKNASVNCGLGDIAKYITDDTYKNRIIFVQGIKGAHAEQNLIIAYCKSGADSKAVIYGKKRPCLGCYLTFMFAREKLGKKNLEFNSNHGGYWSPAVTGFKALLDVAVSQGASLTIDNVEDFFDKNIGDISYRSQQYSSTAPADKRKKRENTSEEDTGYDSGSSSESEMEVDKK